MIISIIEMLYNEKIINISKFHLYKIIKKINKNISYYKMNILIDKLLKTKILLKLSKNIYYFNKIQTIEKRPKIILSFD